MSQPEILFSVRDNDLYRAGRGPFSLWDTHQLVTDLEDHMDIQHTTLPLVPHAVPDPEWKGGMRLVSEQTANLEGIELLLLTREDFISSLREPSALRADIFTLVFIYLFIIFETESHCVAQLASNLCCSCLSQPSARTVGMYYHDQPRLASHYFAVLRIESRALLMPGKHC
jgi:hypothetical protein